MISWKRQEIRDGGPNCYSVIVLFILWLLLRARQTLSKEMVCSYPQKGNKLNFICHSCQRWKDALGPVLWEQWKESEFVPFWAFFCLRARSRLESITVSEETLMRNKIKVFLWSLPRTLCVVYAHLKICRWLKIGGGNTCRFASSHLAISC